MSALHPRVVYGVLAVIVLMFLANGIIHLQAISLTYDESSFYKYAVRLVKGHPERLYPDVDNSKMPVSVLNLAPRIIEQVLHPGLTKNDFGVSDIIHGRYITLFFSSVILLIVYRWSSALYGEVAGLFSTFLTAFCPNLLANAVLVTTDAYSSLALLLTMYCCWRFCTVRSMRRFLMLAVCVGVSQLVKQSLTYLYLIVPAAIAVYYRANRLPVKWKPFVLHTAIFLFTSWLIINLGFYFRGTNTPLGRFAFMSDTFISLQHLLPKWLPLPVPHAFITGLDQAKYYNQVGGGDFYRSSFGNVTILGRSSTGGSFWYYYFVSFFFKTPVSNMLFMAIAAWVVIKRRRLRDFFGKEFFLLLPVAFYVLYMSFLYNTQCGIRQLIFIYPFLYIFCGALVPQITKISQRIMLVALSVVMVIGVMKYRGNFFPYTNELIVDKKQAYRFVGGSNVEFGQGFYFFEQYRRAHPEVKTPGPTPEAGTYLLDAGEYLDHWNLHKHDWIRQFKPTGHVAYNGLLIEVSEDAIKNLQQ